MANASKIAIIIAAVDKASQVVANVVAKTKASMKKLSDHSDKVLKAGLLGAGFFVGTLKAAADVEKLQVALETAYGNNVVAAKAAFKELQKFAAATPYETGEVMRTHIKLMNMGLDASNKALESYGNTASAQGKSLEEMMEAVADAATGEFERLKEFGIRASSQGDKVTFTFNKVSKTVGKNAKEIEDYIKGIGLTKFAGGIEKQSKTLYGKLSTLKDNAISAAATIGNILVPAVNAIMEAVGPVLEKIKAWAEAHPELIKGIAAATVGLIALGAAGKIVAFAVTGLANGLKILRFAIIAISTVFRVVGTLLLGNPLFIIVAAIATAAYLIIDNWSSIKAFFIRLWDDVKRIFRSVIDWIKRAWTNIKNWFVRLWNNIVNFFKRIWQGIKNAATAVWEGMGAIIMKPIEAIKAAWSTLKDFFANLWDSIKSVASGIWSGLTNPFGMQGGSMSDYINDAMKARDAATRANSAMNAAGASMPWYQRAAGINASLPARMATQPIMSPGQSMPVPVSRNAVSSSSSVLNFSPTMNVQGTASAQDIDGLLRDNANKMFKMMNEQDRRRKRLDFNDQDQG